MGEPNDGDATGEAADEGGRPDVAESLSDYGSGDDGQDYVDRDKLDFDPADGLYTGTAVDGPHDADGSPAGESDEAEGESASGEAAESDESDGSGSD